MFRIGHQYTHQNIENKWYNRREFNYLETCTLWLYGYIYNISYCSCVHYLPKIGIWERSVHNGTIVRPSYKLNFCIIYSHIFLQSSLDWYVIHNLLVSHYNSVVKIRTSCDIKITLSKLIRILSSVVPLLKLIINPLCLYCE